MKKSILLTVPKQHKARPKCWAMWRLLPFASENKGEKNQKKKQQES